jgi:hypothetical protein
MEDEYNLSFESDNTGTAEVQLDDVSDDVSSDMPVDIPEALSIDTPEDVLGDIESEDSLMDVSMINQEDVLEDVGSNAFREDDFPKILKQDEFELLCSGNRAIEERIEVLADDYRNQGFSDSRIAELLNSDKIEAQNEFLQDAFPGQELSHSVFNGFDNHEAVESSDFESETLEAFKTEDTIGYIDPVEPVEFRNETEEELGSEELYMLTPNSELHVLHEEDTTIALENMETKLEQTEVGIISEEGYTVTPNSERLILQEGGTVDTLENIQNKLEQTEMDNISAVVVNNQELSEEFNAMYVDDNLSTDNGLIITEEVEEVKIHSDLSELPNWLNDINPNFDEFDTDSPFSNNCGSCAYSVYQRLEGNTDACATADNIGYNDEMTALTGMEQVSMSPKDIETRLLTQGDGAHAIIGIDRADGAGHWFNAACIDGKVVAIDGQTNQTFDWPPDYGDVVNWEMSVKKGDN